MFTLLVVTHLLLAADNPASADCKYRFSQTRECAPVQTVSIDRIDFEIMARDITYSDGTSYPACVGLLYVEGGNVAQFSDLDQPISVTFGRGALHDIFPSRHHVMVPSTLRPGALGRAAWLVEYRNGGFKNHESSESLGHRPYSRGWWVNFNEDHQTIPVSLYISHDRYGSVNYDAVQVPVPNVLLGFDAALTQCRKEIIARADTKVQDFVHRQNIATAEAKTEGAKARKAYYESQIEPLQAQIEELRAIMPTVLAALEDAAEAQRRLLERKAEYARLMEVFSLSESQLYARLFTVVEMAQRAISISVANVEQNRAHIQSNIDRINLMIAEINADIEEASNNLREAERDLQTFNNQ